MAFSAAPVVDLGAWLASRGAAQSGAPLAGPADTLVLVRERAESVWLWLERAESVLAVLALLALVALLAALVPAALKLRGLVQRGADGLSRAQAEVQPLAQRAARVAENVEHVSATVRAQADRARVVLDEAEARLRGALGRAEARARDLEALIEVAQGEAERSIVTAASTVAGVREGVAALRADLADAARGRYALAGGAEGAAEEGDDAEELDRGDGEAAAFGDVVDAPPGAAAGRPRVRRSAG